MRVAFQGVHGAYSEAAAQAFFGSRCASVPFETFEDVFDAVERNRADRGVIPIENSLAGSIHQNYDLLLSHSLHIVGEIHLQIEHALMAHPSASLKTLKHIRSHPQALAQCAKFFSQHKTLKPEPYFDTAGAAEFAR
ncbi:MAG: prephenate dehydratase domain-containing protein, partial [bacterium]